jgi:hypothetical protein
LLRPLEQWEQGYNNILLTASEDGLSEQAIAAARKIKFEPAMKDGSVL